MPISDRNFREKDSITSCAPTWSLTPIVFTTFSQWIHAPSCSLPRVRIFPRDWEKSENWDPTFEIRPNDKGTKKFLQPMELGRWHGKGNLQDRSLFLPRKLASQCCWWQAHNLAWWQQHLLAGNLEFLKLFELVLEVPCQRCRVHLQLPEIDEMTKNI